MMRLFLLCITVFFSTYILADELIVEPDDGRAPIISAIQHASSIELVMYGLTDKKMLQALLNAKDQGKDVRILLEPHPYKSENENSRAAKQLQAADVDLIWADHAKLTHQKTFLFDHHSAMIMTFNLTHSTFKKERNFALLVTDPAMVNEIDRVFSTDATHQTTKVNNPNLFWSPDNSREKILALINTAKSSIEIYAQDINDYQVIGALARAARRGVKTDILLSAHGKMRQGKFNYLRTAGVTIKNSYHYIIHAKVLIIDHKQALIGSINLTTPSLDDNRELSVLTRDPAVIQTLLNTFSQDKSA